LDSGLEGRVAIVTGAAGGIGSAVARALAGEGASIVVVDRPGVELERVSAELPGDSLSVPVDLSTVSAGREIVDAAERRFGRVDVLVAAAGIYDTSSVDELDDRTWDLVNDVNLRAAFLCAQAAAAPMARQGWGRIVLVGSIASMTGGSISASTAYVASKAGVAAMTRSLAGRLGKDQITVNCVIPGMIETPMVAGWAPATREQVIASTPLGRPGQPEEVAAMIVVLASEAASFVTGAHLTIAGGLVMD
jgi:3-oxoacyl-[acyl-carrier protein] reductase